MGYIVLINDVQTDMDGSGLIVGDSQAEADATGLEQSVEVATGIQEYIRNAQMMYASDAPRIMRLLHHIRSKSERAKLASIRTHFVHSLRERNFGVLTGSTYTLQSDLFRKTRICAEEGESIAQCRKRLMKFVNLACSSGGRLIMVSHPFACQIIMNCMLGKDHTTLTSFWFKKGSMFKVSYKSTKHGLSWSPQKTYNALEDKVYKIDDIYGDLLIEKSSE